MVMILISFLLDKVLKDIIKPMFEGAYSTMLVECSHMAGNSIDSFWKDWRRDWAGFVRCYFSNFFDAGIPIKSFEAEIESNQTRRQTTADE